MRRSRSIMSVILMLSLLILLAGCGAKDSSGNRTAQASPGTDGNPTSAVPDLPGDMSALRAALAEPSAMRYRIVMADAPKGADRNAYLDQLLGEKGSPDHKEVLLLIFPQENHDLRFAMGSYLFEKQVSVETMLELVRSHYFGKVGDPAGGLADLIRAINKQVQ